ncbi:ATP-binding protein [Candidatus Neomarinimicrobiota bacterium]
MKNIKNTMKITLSPNWDEIEPLRIQAYDFFGSHELSDNIIHSLVMVLGELLENSVKYGSYKTTDSRIQISINISKKIITIEVTNPVDDTNLNDLKSLDRMVQWVRGYQDPFEAYIERLKEVAKKPLHDKESGLGIVRIAYEGNVILDFFVSEDNLLTVSAVLTR